MTHQRPTANNIHDPLHHTPGLKAPLTKHRFLKKKIKKGGADQIFVGSVLIQVGFNNKRPPTHTRTPLYSPTLAPAPSQVFAGNLALYGMITAIILTQTYYNCE